MPPTTGIAKRIEYQLTPEKRARVAWVHREIEKEQDELIAQARCDKCRSQARWQ